MKKLLSIILSLLTASTMLAAVNQLSFTPNVTITPGGTATITVMMDNQDEVAGFQFEMLLPEGLSVVTNAKGKMEFKLNADRIDDHVVTSNLRKNGKISVMSYSATAEPYYGTSGQILSFAVKADESYTGTHAIEISDINISSCLGVKVNEITTASIEVKAPSDNPVVATSISLDKLYDILSFSEVCIGTEGFLLKEPNFPLGFLRCIPVISGVMPAASFNSSGVDGRTTGLSLMFSTSFTTSLFLRTRNFNLPSLK